MTWRNVKPLAPPVDDAWELVEDKSYALAATGPSVRFMRRHRGMLQVSEQ